MFSPLSHPARLAALARAHGLLSVSIERFRYLELGTIDGTGLRALAAAFPKATFVGTSDAPNSGRLTEMAERLGLPNLTHCVRDALEDTFDFVVLHDQLARLDTDARRAELALIGKLLSADGVALVTYPTLPGAALEGLVRRWVQRAVRPDPASNEQLWALRARLARIERLVPEADDPYLNLLRNELTLLTNELARSPGVSVAPAPAPLSVADVLADARAAGLDHLAEATLATLDGALELSTLRQLLADGLSRPEAEEALDLVVNRRSRASLLVRAGRALPVEPRFASLAAEGYFAAQLTIRQDGSEEPFRANYEPGVPMAFETLTGVRLESDDPLLKAALLALAEAWPRGLNASTLMENAVENLRLAKLASPERIAPSELEATVESLVELAQRRQIELVPWTPTFDDAVGHAPSVRLISRLELARGPVVIDARHHLALLDPFHRTVASLLDGTRNLEECERALADRLDAGALSFDDLPPERNGRARALRLATIGAIVRLRNLGILDQAPPELETDAELRDPAS